MGGCGSEGDSDGGSGDQRTQSTSKKKSKSKSSNKNTFYGDTDLGPNLNQDLMTKEEKKADNLKYGFSRLHKGLQIVDNTLIGKTIETIDRTKTVGKTSEKEQGILRTDLRTGATYKNAPKNRKKPRDGGGNDKPKDIKIEGIELAKASTTSATILGPEQIQKKAANTIKGPTTTEMTADQISLANKRKGRRITNITGATGLAKKYTLSKKTLLG